MQKRYQFPAVCAAVVAGYFVYSAAMLPVYAVSGGNERSNGCGGCHGAPGGATNSIGDAVRNGTFGGTHGGSMGSAPGTGSVGDATGSAGGASNGGLGGSAPAPTSGGGGAGYNDPGCSSCHTDTGALTPGGQLTHAGSQSLNGADGGHHDFHGSDNEGIGTKGSYGHQGGHSAELDGTTGDTSVGGAGDDNFSL